MYSTKDIQPKQPTVQNHIALKILKSMKTYTHWEDGSLYSIKDKNAQEWETPLKCPRIGFNEREGR